MRFFVTPVFDPRRLLMVLAALAFCSVSVSHAAPVPFSCVLSGPAESPPNASPGSGLSVVVIDAVAHTMSVHIEFHDLIGNTTASHIHAPTAVAGSGTAGVATTTPTFAGFPLGVTVGVYSIVLDMTQASSYNPTYITNNGGTTATAEAALFQAITDGRAYVNVHSNAFPGGEIRGFLAPGDITVPTVSSTWGRVKSLYR